MKALYITRGRPPFLAILTFVPTGLHAQSSVLTADQQKKITALLVTYGKDVALGSTVTAAFGAAKGMRF